MNLIRRHPKTATAIGLLALVVLSYWLRSQALWAKLWIDEGLSIGIAQHPLWDIPGVLRQDGAPPLYYMLLHLWIGLAGGDGEARTHSLSLLFALLAIPTGWYWGRRLFGTASGWASAALLATLPFLTYYAQETRMYALVVLLGLVATAAFAATYALRDRRALPWFVLFGALTPYAHNWGLFMLAACGLAFLALVSTAPVDERRALWRDGVIGFGLIALLYAPWLPTLIDQAGSTGAPWAARPGPEQIVNILQVVAGGGATALAVVLVGGWGLSRTRTAEPERARAAVSLLTIVIATVVLAWLLSQISPAWAVRYVAVVVGPALLLAGAGLVRAGPLGLVTLAVVLVLWWQPQQEKIESKSNVFTVARTLSERGLLRQGDTVLSVHPEHGPVLRYYVGSGYRFWDALGPVPDPQVFDWRHATERLEASGPKRVLGRLAPAMEPGARLVLVEPLIRSGSWDAPWTELVRRRASQWERAVDQDPRFRRIAELPRFGHEHPPRGVRAIVYVRR